MADTPYLSLQRFPGDGVTTDWSVSFAGNRPDAASGTEPYISPADIKAYEEIPSSATMPAVRIDRDVVVIGPSQFRVSPAVATGNKLVIYRSTESRYPLVDYANLQTVSEFDLDQSNRQTVFLAQEATDNTRLAQEVAESAEQVAYSSVAVAANALDVAGNAVDIAESAVASAAQANNTANEAVITAEGAVVSAAEATDIAESAVLIADDASVVAYGVDAKATLALDNAAAAVETANEAMSLVSEAGVATFNGRSGAVVPTDTDYSSGMIQHGPQTVAEVLGELRAKDGEQDAALLGITGAITDLEEDVAGRLPAEGTAVNADRLGGQLPSYYGTQAAVNTLNNSKLDKALAHRPNLFINSSFNTAQRGVGPWETVGYTFDRWLFFRRSGTAVGSLLRVNPDRPENRNTNLFAVRIKQVAANVSSYTFGQRVEDVGRLVGPITVSCDARYALGATPPSIRVRIVQNFGAGGSASIAYDTVPVELSLDNQRVQFAVTIPAFSGKTLGANNHTQVDFEVINMGAQEVFIAGPKLEYGLGATPYEVPDRTADELACYRYYYRFVPMGWNFTMPSVGARLARYTALPVPMRREPTINHDLAAGVGGVGIDPSSIVLHIDARNRELRWLALANASGPEGWLSSLTATGKKTEIILDAEL